MKLVFDGRALDDIEAMGAWWRANRLAAPDLFEEELAAVLDLIRRAPASVAIYRARTGGERVRRLLMPRTKNHVYFVHDAATQVVRVVALWGAVKRRGPPLG